MKVWITTAGTSPFAAINSIWAAILHEDFIPTRIHILANEYVIQKKFLDQVVQGCELLMSGYDIHAKIQTHEFEETDFSSYFKKLKALVEKEKLAKNEVAIDMTPGRKYMSAFSMHLGVGKDITHRADRIYYHHLLDLSYGAYPYPLIPSNLRKLYIMNKARKEE